jgi:saccharopine dehydrogenase-like NADP-dependent oxidoreductase
MDNTVLVLGCGLVGSKIALDLSTEFSVTVADKNPDALFNLKKRAAVEILQKDLSDPDLVRQLAADFDLVVGAMPGFLGYRTLQAVIEAGKDIVDISFFPEDPFLLHELALSKNVTALIDCGVAPGMGNIILGYHQAQMQVFSYQCYVGGLPVERQWPYEYKAVFSPIDVIEEYVRPARYVQDGHLVIREALSDPELMDFPGIGTLEAWNSDGLRTLIHTMQVPNMIEKTLRYPGTIEYLRVLRESGFFSYEPVEVDGHAIRPIDLTARLLFPKWELKPGEADLTVMKIIIKGTAEGVEKEIVYDLDDRYDPRNDTISMARTTGFTAAAVLHLLSREEIVRPGICPPEYLGEDQQNFFFILDYLKQRGVNYRVS